MAPKPVDNGVIWCYNVRNSQKSGKGPCVNRVYLEQWPLDQLKRCENGGATVRNGRQPPSHG